MRGSTPYKTWIIFGESFQREKHGPWVSQYRATQASTTTGAYAFPSQQYQLNNIFLSEHEADDFALLKARQWIDKR